MRHCAGWTDDRVNMLKALWAAGLSASKIGGELGGVSRNAIIGKARRVGLSARAEPKWRNPYRDRPASPRKRKRAPRINPQALPARVQQAFVAVGPVTPLHIAFLDLNAQHCRWPYGDGPFTFCGHRRADEDTSYCAYHARVSAGRLVCEEAA